MYLSGFRSLLVKYKGSKLPQATCELTFLFFIHHGKLPQATCELTFLFFIHHGKLPQATCELTFLFFIHHELNLCRATGPVAKCRMYV